MAQTKSPQHSRSGIALVLLNALVLFITCVFVVLANVAKDAIPGLFLQSIGESIGDDTVVEDVYININPAPWTFALVWGTIYLLQLMFVGYSLSLLCRSGPDNYLYLSPPEMIPSPAYWAYIIANISGVTWLFLNDRDFVLASGILIALFAFLVILALGFALRGIHATTPALRANGLDKEILLNRIFVQNGLAAYTTWLVIATLVSLTTVLATLEVLEQDIAGRISLGILAGELLVWFLLDVTVLARFTNYMIMPYVIAIVGLAGIIDFNFVAWETNSLFSVILIIFACFTFIVKVTSTVFRHRASSKDADSMASTTVEP